MPTRSLNSSVLKWPSADEVEKALHAWVKTLNLPELVALGYFGSYARGDYGVGSDLDLVLVVRESHYPFVERAAHLPLEKLPVPAEALVYTEDEWKKLIKSGSRFAQTLARETRWLINATAPPAESD